MIRMYLHVIFLQRKNELIGMRIFKKQTFYLLLLLMPQNHDKIKFDVYFYHYTEDFFATDILNMKKLTNSSLNPFLTCEACMTTPLPSKKNEAELDQSYLHVRGGISDMFHGNQSPSLFQSSASSLQELNSVVYAQSWSLQIALASIIFSIFMFCIFFQSSCQYNLTSILIKLFLKVEFI